MEQQPPPVYVICPGRVYRRDALDPTHSPMFQQVEGLAVDRGLSLAHLKGTLEHFARALFGPEREIRLRSHYFPFTEPSVELDVSCFLCGGAGCRVCKGEGWIEILGAGMVDPNVFGFVPGYDPEVVSGWAFGMGIERVAMLKYGIPHVKSFYDNDVRFLEQFRGPCDEGARCNGWPTTSAARCRRSTSSSSSLSLAGDKVEGSSAAACPRSTASRS